MTRRLGTFVRHDENGAVSTEAMVLLAICASFAIGVAAMVRTGTTALAANVAIKAEERAVDLLTGN